MKAAEFYRILTAIVEVRWEIRDMPKEKFGVPSRKTFIRGTMHSFYYSPLSAVATMVACRTIDISNRDISKILGLDRRTFRRIKMATYQHTGYSPVVRRKIFKACHLPYYRPST